MLVEKRRLLRPWAFPSFKDHSVNCAKEDGRHRTLTPNTLSTYKSILKRFLCYVFAPDEFPNAPPPPIVAWVRTHVRRADVRRLQRNDLLTPDDIQKLLGVCRSTRDKALIATLWETGSRIAELGNLQLRHVTKTVHGYSLDLEGKTGRRTVLVVSSAPYLAQWLANHPFKDNANSPLWVRNRYEATPEHLQYGSIRYLLTHYFALARINKPFHPHIFRHSRATFLLSQGLMNESQAKAYFGWTANSDMLGTYSHLVDQDANNAILRENNLEPPREYHDDLKPIVCHACNELNPPGTEYCTKCTAILDLKRAYEHQHAQQLHDNLSMTIVKLLVDKGLLDDAATAVHDAGLGAALKRLAEQQHKAPPGTVTPERAARTTPAEQRT